MKRTVVSGIILAGALLVAFSTLLVAGQGHKGQTMGPALGMGGGPHGEMPHGEMKHGEMPHGHMEQGAKDHRDLATHLAEKTERWDPKNGQAIYERLCLSCHGATGRGDGPVGKLLTPRPANFVEHMSHHAEDWVDYYFQIIKGGGAATGRSPLMPPWGGQLNDQEIWDVVSYLHTFMHHP
ncbi:MAG: c-type cytochrome [Candidatus Tectimicrobiota bacterium]